MTNQRGARFDSNPVQDVFLVSSSPLPVASSDDIEDLPTPPTLPFVPPNTPKPHTILLPDVSTPFISSTPLPKLPDVAHTSTSSSLPEASPVLPSPMFSTPSPTATIVHLHPALESFIWDARGSMPSLAPSKRDSPATEPPLPELVLSTGHLPWMVTVQAASTAAAVTVGNVLDSLQEFFRTTVTRTEWDAAKDLKEAIRQRFKTRCGDDDEEISEGVRRVDYLPDGAMITGLGSYPGGREENLSIKVVVVSSP